MKGDRLYRQALIESQSHSPDLAKVFQLLSRSSSQNNAKATYALGTWYLFGKYVEQDNKKAFSLISIAANQHHPEACYDLAVSYEKGVGVDKDLAISFHITKKLRC